MKQKWSGGFGSLCHPLSKPHFSVFSVQILGENHLASLFRSQSAYLLLFIMFCWYSWDRGGGPWSKPTHVWLLLQQECGEQPPLTLWYTAAMGLDAMLVVEEQGGERCGPDVGFALVTSISSESIRCLYRCL